MFQGQMKTEQKKTSGEAKPANTKPHQMIPEIHRFLTSVDLFKSMSKAALKTLYENVEEIAIGSHEFIYRSGDQSEYIYIIRYGEVMVRLGPYGESLRYLVSGDILSESSVLTGTPHAGSAQALLDTLLYAIRGDIFLKLATDDKILSQNLNSLMSRRIRDYFQHGRGASFVRRLICHIPIEPIPGYISRLKKVVALGKSSYEQAITMLDIEELADKTVNETISILAELRSKYPIVHLYFSKPQQACRMDRVVMQCDQIVLWEQGDSISEEKDQLEKYWCDCIRNFEVRSVRMIQGGHVTARQSYGGRRKVFIRPETLARYLVSKTRGLSLGGGGARAVAHIGMLKVLEEEGIEIDYVSGASFGAVIGALYARGETVSSIVDMMETFFGRLEKPFLDPTLPLIAFYRGKKMEQMLKDAFGDQRIEDLHIPFATSAVDIISGREVVLDQGLIWKALAATMSLPGVFPPRWYQGHLLIDGGILNNVPESLIRAKGANVIVSVNVAPLEDSEMSQVMERKTMRERLSITGIWDRIRHPPILKIIGRAITLEGRELLRLKKESMDLFINFEMQEYSIFTFSRYKEIIAKGELQFRHFLPQVRELFLPGKYGKHGKAKSKKKNIKNQIQNQTK